MKVDGVDNILRRILLGKKEWWNLTLLIQYKLFLIVKCLIWLDRRIKQSKKSKAAL